MIKNIECLFDACQELGVPFKFIDKNNNFAAVGEKPSYFMNATTPLNDESVSVICKDKEYTYKALEDKINMPKTIGYFDPSRTDYKEYIKLSSIKEICKNIIENFSLPVIIKRNSGSMGKNVFLCKTIEEIKSALEVIYSHSKEYDYIALAQQFIEIKKEYRIIVLNKKIELVYEKDISQATFEGNLSPLHWSKAKAIEITDTKTILQFEKFIKPIFNVIDINWCGLDVTLDRIGNLHLIEINSKPGFAKFIEHCGKSKVIEIYKKIILMLKCTKISVVSQSPSTIL